MKALSPALKALADKAPADWEPLPAGIDRATLTGLVARQVVEVTGAPRKWRLIKVTSK